MARSRNRGKKGNGDTKFDFRKFCEGRGANPDGLSFAVTEAHVDDLVSRIETLDARGVTHSEVYIPVYDTLTRLKDAKEEYDGSGKWTTGRGQSRHEASKYLAA